MQKKLDEIANLWEKTKNPRYKNQWYKLVKEIARTHGYYNSKRRTIPITTSVETDPGWNSVNK
jgi:hypothetical protein